jgi:exosortase H (IPTLxxWG-CTERM-specific)
VRKKKRPRIRSSVQKPVDASRRLTLRDMISSKRIAFAIAFALFCIALYAVILALPPSFTMPINENTAWSLGVIMNAFGIPALAARDTVSEGDMAFKIIPECTPIFIAILFAGFVIFYPARLRDKATGLLAGLPILYFGNVTRLAVTFMISRYDRRLFDLVHVYLGQVFTMCLLVLVCMAWLRWVDRQESEQSIPVKTAGFIVRFAAISGGLCLVWTQIHHSYIRLLDRLMIFGFSLFGYGVGLAQHTGIYYETFSIVCLTSLALAVRSIPWPRKIKGLAAGLGFLFLSHLLHRIDNALAVYFNFTAVLPADLTLLVIEGSLLPVLFLIYLVHYQKKDVPKPTFGRYAKSR